MVFLPQIVILAAEAITEVTEAATEAITEAVGGAAELVTEALSGTESITEAVTEETTEFRIVEVVLGEDTVAAVEEVVKDPSLIAQWWSGTFPQILAFALKVILAIVVLVVGVKLINMFVRFIRRSFEKGNMDKGVQTFLASVIKYALYFILIMLILSSFGVAASSVVAILGSAGLTIGLGFQGSLSNFAGGVLILMLKPFEVGEYIAADDKEGTVTDITVCYTHLLTIDNIRIVIPNGTLSNTTITNYTRMEKRRIDLKIGITYESDLLKAKDIVWDLMRADERILQDEANMVIISALEDSSVIVEMRAWTMNAVYWKTRWDFIEKIKLAFDDAGIVIAYPHMTVEMEGRAHPGAK